MTDREGNFSLGCPLSLASYKGEYFTRLTVVSSLSIVFKGEEIFFFHSGKVHREREENLKAYNALRDEKLTEEG